MPRRMLEFFLPSEISTGRRLVAVGFALLVLLKVAAAIFLATGDLLAFYRFATTWLDSGMGDAWRYYEQFDPVGASHVPPTFPYPPGMLLFVGLLRLPTYLLGFTAIEYSPLAGLPLGLARCVLDLATASLLWRIGGQLGLGARLRATLFWGWHLSLIALLGTFIKSHIDIAAVFLTVLSLHLLLRQSFLFSGVLLSIAVATKHYPLILFAPWTIYVLRAPGLSVRRRAAVLAGFAAGLACVVALLYLPFLHSQPFAKMVLLSEESARVWYSTYSYIQGHLWVYLTVVACGTILFLAWTATGDPRRMLVVTSASLLMVLTTLVIPQSIWHLWNAPFAVLACALIPRGWWLFMFYGLAHGSYFIYYKWSPLYQLAMYHRSGWPMKTSPWQLLSDAAGNASADKLEMILFSLLLASQLAILAASAWRPGVPQAEDPASSQPAPRGSLFRDARAAIVAVAILAAFSGMLHARVGREPVPIPVRLSCEASPQTRVRLGYRLAGSNRLMFPVFGAPRPVIIEALPGKASGGGVVFARPFAGNRLAIKNFDLGPGWSCWRDDRLFHRFEGDPAAARAVLRRDSDDVRLTHIDLLRCAAGGRARVLVGDEVVFEGDLVSAQDRFQRVEVPPQEGEFLWNLPSDASDAFVEIPGKPGTPPSVHHLLTGGAAVAEPPAFDSETRTWRIKVPTRRQ